MSSMLCILVILLSLSLLLPPSSTTNTPKSWPSKTASMSSMLYPLVMHQAVVVLIIHPWESTVLIHHTVTRKKESITRTAQFNGYQIR
ncbi:hypothetical protein CXB51_026004 [Gossypium anomalum]|uniref:Secreted protein n=1 Tax=Gossypium anomalum TaxID=47600 RepID=A0A8J5YH95_9ROSI|nr:hypothetical protein CXB51_026004 [Gossypium anomalum]